MDDDSDPECAISPDLARSLRPALGMSMSMSMSAMPPNRWSHGPPREGESSLESVRRELMTARSKLAKLRREQKDNDEEEEEEEVTPLSTPLSTQSKQPQTTATSPFQGEANAMASGMLAHLRSKMNKLLLEEAISDERRRAAVECILQIKTSLPTVSYPKESDRQEQGTAITYPGRRGTLRAEDLAEHSAEEQIQRSTSAPQPHRGPQVITSRLCFPIHPDILGPRGDSSTFDPFSSSASSSVDPNEVTTAHPGPEVPYCAYSPLRIDSHNTSVWSTHGDTSALRLARCGSLTQKRTAMDDSPACDNNLAGIPTCSSGPGGNLPHAQSPDDQHSASSIPNGGALSQPALNTNLCTKNAEHDVKSKGSDAADLNDCKHPPNSASSAPEYNSKPSSHKSPSAKSGTSMHQPALSEGCASTTCPPVGDCVDQLEEERITHDIARENFIGMLKSRLAQKASKLPQRPLSKEEAEELDRIQCRWAELTWASPEFLEQVVSTPGRGAIMSRRRTAADCNQTFDTLQASEQWKRHEIQKEGARELGVLYRQLLEYI